MGPKQVVNTFTEGMNKDMDKSLVSNRSYLDALNFRLVTTEGGTSGAMENIKGNKQLSQLLDNTHSLTIGKTYYVYGNSIVHDTDNYNAGDQFVASANSFTGSGYVIEKVKEDQIIIGGVEMRDKIILFTTNNTSTSPNGGRSCIYEMQIDLANEQLVEDSLELLYDDNLNEGLNSTDFLNFSTAYPIKAIARYETENLQRVYWNDGYNYIRYATVSETFSGVRYSEIKSSLTISKGTSVGSNRYIPTDMFNLSPNFDFRKAEFNEIISGSLNTGMVQYTYQLYRTNGAETTFAPLSNIIHITDSNDYSANDYAYMGAEDPDTNSGKGIKIKISNSGNTGFDNARLVRLYYPTLNSVPSVSAVDEKVIALDGSDFYMYDRGIDLGTYTASELVFSNTSLFTPQDIETKNNRLFAANIETDYFSLGQYDSRAVRFKNYSGVIEAVVEDVEGNVTIDQPVDTSSLSSWQSAGWDEDQFPYTHDSICPYNTKLGLYRSVGVCIYQADGVTPGAEGPNLTVGFTTSDFILDQSSVGSSQVFCSVQDYGSASNPSFESYSSPWRTGERSFQRGEVYRFSVVFYNDKGQASFPQWICDLKMPNVADDFGNYYISYTDGTGDEYGRDLYPTFNFRRFPTGATSAQIYVVPREAEDRTVYTQGLALPVSDSKPTYAATALSGQILKLVSPEIMINNDMPLSSGDYLEATGYYSSTPTTVTDTNIEKLGGMTTESYTDDVSYTNLLSDVNDAVKVSISDSSYLYPLGFTSFTNYNTTDNWYGSTGFIVNHANASWGPLSSSFNLVNYRKDTFTSQYGGQTYEDRSRNYYRPCSDILTSTGVTYTAKGGDTFINYFDVSTSIFDLTKASGSSEHETVYVPLESSVNCNLRHDESVSRMQIGAINWALIQEVAGEHEDNSVSPRTYTQNTDLYQYNTVYSQLDTLGYKYARPYDWEENIIFDTTIKVSEVKVNGESSDSWASFLTNNFIEVNSSYGPINALHVFNNRLYCFQDKGIGIASVNDRSLIQDSSGNSLVLGSGGVLDRYDYISTNMGTQDKFSVVTSKSGLYWYDALTGSVYTTNGSNLANLSKAKYIDSYFKNNSDTSYSVRSVHDVVNDEVLFTFMKSSTSDSFTIAYNEIVGTFTSFYSFLPTVYIPFKSKVFSTTTSTYSGVTDSGEFLWSHNSDDVDRCQFYAIYTDDTGSHYDSTVKVIFNPDYNYTKVFDALTIIGNTYSSGTTEVYNKMFDEIRCYDDYQNTDTWTLTYDGTYSGTTQVLPYQRRERSWKTFVPRNAVSVNLTGSPDIFSAGNLDTTETYKDRMRDKYLVTDLTFENDGTYGKFVFSNIGLTYRTSYR